ncbi:MAG: hypothetical protein AAFX99_32810, partial [Myxococcota bacterium]
MTQAQRRAAERPDNPSSSRGWSVRIEAPTPQALMDRLRYETFMEPQDPIYAGLSATLLGAFGIGIIGVIPALLAGMLSLFAPADLVYIVFGALFGGLAVGMVYVQYS